MDHGTGNAERRRIPVQYLGQVCKLAEVTAVYSLHALGRKSRCNEMHSKGRAGHSHIQRIHIVNMLKEAFGTIVIGKEGRG